MVEPFFCMGKGDVPEEPLCLDLAVTTWAIIVLSCVYPSSSRDWGRVVGTAPACFIGVVQKGLVGCSLSYNTRQRRARAHSEM